MKQMSPDAIEGFRGFMVERDRLISPFAAGHEWVPGINTSRCPSCGDTPRRRCRCGFYSFITQETAVEEWADEVSLLGRTLSGTPVRTGGGRDLFVLATIRNAGIIWKGTRGYRAQHAQVSALLTNQPDLYSRVLERYDLIAVRPFTRDDRGVCEGIVYGFGSGGPHEALVKIAGLTPQDRTGDYRMDPTSRAYGLVAVAGTGAHVEVSFEVRDGKRWVRDISVHAPG